MTLNGSITANGADGSGEYGMDSPASGAGSGGK